MENKEEMIETVKKYEAILSERAALQNLKAKNTNDMRQKLAEIIIKLQAIEVLEYHDKNLLANSKFVSQQKQEMLSRALEILGNYKLDEETNE